MNPWGPFHNKKMMLDLVGSLEKTFRKFNFTKTIVDVNYPNFDLTKPLK